MENSLEPWKARGYQFDEGLNMPSGKIKNNNRSLCFYSENEPTIGITIARWTLQAHLGRRIKAHEIVRFKTKDKLDLRKTNLVFHSKLATAKELFEMNGPPILGYSHCMCGCGQALDVLQQGDQPHAFVVGHSPADKRRTATLQAAVDKIKPKRKRGRRPRVKTETAQEKPTVSINIEGWENPWNPNSWSLIKQAKVMKEDPFRGKSLAMASDPLCPFRPLFEKMICDLPWDKFKRLLTVLMQMEHLEVQPCPTEFVKK